MQKVYPNCIQNCIQSRLGRHHNPPANRDAPKVTPLFRSLTGAFVTNLTSILGNDQTPQSTRPCRCPMNPNPNGRTNRTSFSFSMGCQVSWELTNYGIVCTNGDLPKNHTDKRPHLLLSFAEQLVSAVAGSTAAEIRVDSAVLTAWVSSASGSRPQRLMFIR